MLSRLTLLSLLLYLTGCSPISVQMDYLSRHNLPSYQVGTPDPKINHPPIGERLIIQWYLPKRYLKYDNPHMEVTIRYRNNEEVLVTVPLKHRSGTYIYDLINEDYYNTCGILTYKIEVFGSGCLLKEWKHQLWANLITFPEEEIEFN